MILYIVVLVKEDLMEQPDPIVIEPILTKPDTRGKRMLRSERARSHRKLIKDVRETRILNEWAKNRRIRKKSK